MSSRNTPEFWIGRNVWDETIQDSYTIEEVLCDSFTGKAKVGIGKLHVGTGWVTVDLDDIEAGGNC